VSQLFQFLAQLAVVFNNAILNHRHSPFSICMRMGVVLRLAVSPSEYVQSQSELGFLCVVVFSQIVEFALWTQSISPSQTVAIPAES